MDIVPRSSTPINQQVTNNNTTGNIESVARVSNTATATSDVIEESLVSEQEDDYDEGQKSSRSGNRRDANESGVVIHTNGESTNNENDTSLPTEIPLDGNEDDKDDDDDDDEDEESDYEYCYSDEETCHISFLRSDPILDTSSAKEKDDSALVSSASSPPQDGAISSSSDNKRKSTWKEPSQAAVSMSLRAEKEKTGGKRRLASDLYKIMTGDTTEQGFSLEPVSEDSMDKWRIKLLNFDADSNLHKDLVVLNLDHIELEMSFPDAYPFEPPFVRVVTPRFQKQTGFVMNGALCMELLTTQGWNPVNDIESVIVSIRSLIVVGDGRLAGMCLSHYHTFI